MAKNGSNKQPAARRQLKNKKPTRRERTKQPSKKQVAGNSDKKAKAKSPNSRKPANVRGLKPQNVPATKQKPTKGINKKPNAPLTNYQKADSYKKISNLLKKEKRLRFKGRFISKETQETILKFSKILDKEDTNYTLQDLLNVPEIQNKILITKDETPKQLFYWNIYNSIARKTKNKTNPLGDELKFEVKDFDGKTIYKGESELKAAEATNALNKKIQNLEKVMNLKENTGNIYPTIAVYETRRNGENIKITVDYSGVKVMTTAEIWNKYKTML